jgi:hypothetical protein
MKKLANLLMPILCFLMFSCGHKDDPSPPCNDPKPLQPSFTQDKYQVHLGESVTFTYDGPTQPAGVTLVWIQLSADDNSPDLGQTANGLTVTFKFNYLGGHKIWLKAQNCNADEPQILKNPAVMVVP